MTIIKNITNAGKEAGEKEHIHCWGESTAATMKISMECP
jgi:hypothetical protein